MKIIPHIDLLTQCAPHSLTAPNLISLPLSFSFQYYEMSYGLNVEMHKQVSELLLKEDDAEPR